MFIVYKQNKHENIILRHIAIATIYSIHTNVMKEPLLENTFDIKCIFQQAVYKVYFFLGVYKIIKIWQLKKIL